MLNNDKTMKQLHNDSFIDCIMKVASAPSINEEASQQLHQGMNQEMANLSRRRVALNTRHKDLMDILAKDYEQGVHRSDMNTYGLVGTGIGVGAGHLAGKSKWWSGAAGLVGGSILGHISGKHKADAIRAEMQRRNAENEAGLKADVDAARMGKLNQNAVFTNPVTGNRVYTKVAKYNGTDEYNRYIDRTVLKRNQRQGFDEDVYTLQDHVQALTDAERYKHDLTGRASSGGSTVGALLGAYKSFGNPKVPATRSSVVSNVVTSLVAGGILGGAIGATIGGYKENAVRKQILDSYNPHNRMSEALNIYDRDTITRSGQPKPWR